MTYLSLSQAETINRLLKKQSRPQAKNKRVAQIKATSQPTTKAPTPASASDAGEEDDGDGEGEEDGEEDSAQGSGSGRGEPQMYRWVSGAGGITLSVPASLLPTPPPLHDGMEVDMDTSTGTSRGGAREGLPALCDVQSCGVPRKYRLVGNWERGACGMDHLKILELQQVA
ncbi:hypothetical protein FIBSPDRAFT_526598 [Athelia psychrophila]|uniref:INO80 complex subunit B-like conserved region domain-containing protein n=1 Tax=Athelia psychrophila TaxID=1759441 RepID=A0A166JKI6_9AGAM|nr:hypothetical protein FIBSPDRAFT_526598 [Fibularhizoctonia sp. CBS 109695]